MIVKQFLHPNCESVLNLMTCLQDVSGLVWLQDAGQNVIGLFPKWQCIAVDFGKTIRLERVGCIYQSRELAATFEQSIKQFWHATIDQKNNTMFNNTAFDSTVSGDTVSDNNASEDKHFSGGLMGFIGYDYAAAQQIDAKPVAQADPLAALPAAAPKAIIGEYDIFLRQEVEGWQLYGPDCPELATVYAYIKARLGHVSTAHLPYSFVVSEPFQPVWNKGQYAQAFDAIQQYLRQGDCYQVNLTQPFKAQIRGSLISTIEPLMALTKASYAGYMGYKDFELLSCSPELFVAFKADGQVVTKPIKGTRPRHFDLKQDEHLKQQLLGSEKDRAENLMIVDLLRNDLSVYAQTGSVRVPKLFEIESFAQVHHMVSEICATLQADASPLDVLFSALPGGSITGAPKIRAMQIIDELEAEPRGAYCGSMGYLNYNNTGQFNILIRSLQKRDDTLTVWAGGGITIASECSAEYQECLDKIGAILTCVEKIGAD